MRIQELAPDVVMFVGDEVESVATAFMDGDRALLVDALGRDMDRYDVAIVSNVDGVRSKPSFW